MEFQLYAVDLRVLRPSLCNCPATGKVTVRRRMCLQVRHGRRLRVPVHGDRQLRGGVQSRGTLRQLEVTTSLRYDLRC